VFGRTSAFVSAVEFGSYGLHIHVLAMAAMPSWAFAVLAGEPRLHSILASVLDSMINCELPVPVHAQSMLRKLFKFSSYRAPWYAHDPNLHLENLNISVKEFNKPNTFQNLKDHVYFATTRVQEHDIHGSRCRKPPMGITQCSQNVERTLQNETTTFEISREVDPLTKSLIIKKVVPRLASERDPNLDVINKPIYVTEIKRMGYEPV
jgi:hypothetical protein